MDITAAVGMQLKHEAQDDRRTAAVGMHYDFIEVGTADHNTITQYCDYGHSASWVGSEIWSLRYGRNWARGLAVDPSRHHLEALPDLPLVQKVNVAMDEWLGQNDFYSVSPEDINQYMGKYHTFFGQEPWHWEVDVMWYAGSLGSLGKPHPNLEFMLSNIGRADLLKDEIVEVYDWAAYVARTMLGLLMWCNSIAKARIAQFCVACSDIAAKVNCPVLSNLKLITLPLKKRLSKLCNPWPIVDSM